MLGGGGVRSTRNLRSDAKPPFSFWDISMSAQIFLADCSRLLYEAASPRLHEPFTEEPTETTLKHSSDTEIEAN